MADVALGGTAMPPRTRERPARTAAPPRHLSPLDDARLVPPRVREGVVARADLVHRLRPTARSTVALIVAPGGYGKTTLLTLMGKGSRGRPLVWIGIDQTDN